MLAAAAGASALWPGGGGHPRRPAARRADAARRRAPGPAPTGRRSQGSIGKLLAGLPLSDGVLHGDPARRMVALTFDDGPSGRTPAILRVLAKHDAHATFFVVGRATRGLEPTLRSILAHGNELGDHTYSHADMLALKPAKRGQRAAAGRRR